ncbi:MAG TPA: tRNA pseudouridine(55) synthase TruB [Stellaceae bacterium]|jgi:tRNA pseudouridine55 synthase
MPVERGLHGWLVIDKPLGLTSHSVVAQIRRRTNAKAGHAGTLDPLATGVLPVALGEATKTVSYAMNGRKGYRFCVGWGIARSTDDGEGEIVGESAVRPSRAEIEAMLPRFTGTVAQVPPVYSAIKVGGRRAYALARAAAPPALAPRLVEIADFRLTAMTDRDHAEFEAVVGKGTYIRALARDLAAALGTCGHIAALRRLSVGPFTEAQAIPLEAVGDQQHLLPVGSALDGLPALVLAAGEAQRLRCGQRVRPADGEGCALLDRLGIGAIVGAWYDHALIAMARIEDGSLRPLRILNC